MQSINNVFALLQDHNPPSFRQLADPVLEEICTEFGREERPYCIFEFLVVLELPAPKEVLQRPKNVVIGRRNVWAVRRVG